MAAMMSATRFAAAATTQRSFRALYSSFSFSQPQSKVEKPPPAEPSTNLFVSGRNIVLRSTKLLRFNNKKKLTSSNNKPCSADDDGALKTYLSSITTSKSPTFNLHGIIKYTLNPHFSNNDDAADQLSTDVSNSLRTNKLNLDWEDEHELEEGYLGEMDMPFFPTMSNISVSPRRKEINRVKKHKSIFKPSQNIRFSKLVEMCAKRLGTDATLAVFQRLGKESGLKEYITFVNICIDKARAAKDEEASLEQIHKVHQIFKSVRESGFKIDEEMYGQFLLYLIDNGMVDEFFYFSELIRDDNPDCLPRLAYYEMLLWLRVGNENKIQQLCRSAIADSSKSYLRENLLMALCESDRKEDFLMLLQTTNVTEISSVSYLVSVFRSLGKFLLEPIAERFVLALKNSDIGGDNISNLICEYAISIPKLSVEDILVTFQMLHAKLEVLPTSAQYEKLIRHSCNLHKVHEAIKIVDEAFGCGLSVSLETFNSLLVACNQAIELNLVHKINSMIRCHNLKPNAETFRLMIHLSVKMKDFEGAYEMISDLKKMELKPTVGIYNILLSGFCREKNFHSAKNVLKQMEDEGVIPDATTFSCLIANSNREEDIIKYYEQMSSLGIPPVKPVYMALINAYAACGQFNKAKEVILDKGIPPNILNEIKSVLVAALASNRQLSCALKLYEDMKKAECNLEPKAVSALIEHSQSEGDLDKLLELLEESTDSYYRVDSCFRVLSFCLKQEKLRPAVDLIKQIKDNFTSAGADTEIIFDEAFSTLAEKTDTQFGLSFLKAIKEELCVRPSRKSLDFLLTSCVNAKDANASFVIWKEYETAGLPYNVLTYTRMYQALLASGDCKSAAEILSKIPRDDLHIRYVISACDRVYNNKVPSFVHDTKKWKALSEIMYP